jgi:8-oxo-dGTP pyrophosphatase MutT (NUDIX family)
MKVKRLIHQMWKAHQDYPVIEKMGLSNQFGKYQYIFSSKKGKISLIKFRGALGTWRWEMCGGGLQKEEAFRTKKDAVIKITRLLN